MRSVRAAVASALWLGGAFGLSGCAVPHTMQPHPYGYHCPESDHSATTQAISWVGPAQRPDTTKLAMWCQTVGPTVVDSIPAATLSPDTGYDPLMVVTWNLKGGSGDLVRFLHDELRLTCNDSLSTTGDGFRHFVLMVQEAYRRSTAIPPFPVGETAPLAIDEEQWSGRQDIVTLARKCGLALYYSPSMRNGATEFDGQREDKGNAILSSLPLHDFLAIELPFETQRRIVVGATVLHPAGDSLRVLSLHLDVSPGLWRVLKTGNSSRLRQAMGIVDALALIERSRSGRPFVEADLCQGTCRDSIGSHPISTVMTGDFNTWTDGQTVLRHMVDYFPESPPTDGLPTRGEFPADHMFFRQRTSWDGDEPQLVPESYRRLDKQYGSDHKARLLDLRLRP